MPIIISIDGNIGSGKSTLINILKKYRPNYHIIDEPVNQWQNITDNNGTNLLQKFYEDPTRWGYTFQNFAYITRLKALQDAIKTDHKIIITERSIFTDKNIFAKMLYENNKISKIEWDIYNFWFDNFKIDITGNIYLQTLPEICKKRITKRSRNGEDNMDNDYLQKLHDKHNKVFNTNTVLQLDGNLDFKTDKSIQNNMLDQIDIFINKYN